MERGALRRLPEIIAELGSFHRLVMVCDDNTYAAAGNAIRDIFRSHPAFRLQIICLPTGGEIRALLSHMGAKVTWEDLGISQATGEALYEAAPFVRRRLTLMRLYKLISRS